MNTYMYIFIMFAVTYAIRVLPMTRIRKEIKNTFIKSFLYYVPYVTLAVMTFPAILTATASVISAAVGFGVALLIAYFDGNLFKVAMGGCVAVFLVELFL